MATLSEIARVLTGLEELYPHARKLSDGAVGAYAQIFADVPVELLETAARRHLASSQFFPTVAELSAQVIDLMARAAGVPTAVEAWEEVLTRPEPVLRSYYCDVGWELRERARTGGLTGNDYWDALHARTQHEDNCEECYQKETSQYSHPLVAKALRAVGRTENEAADRSQYLKAYEQLLKRGALDAIAPALPERVNAAAAGLLEKWTGGR